MKQRFGVHVCLLDRECRQYAGRVLRVEVNSPWWHFGVALRPGDRYVRQTEDGGFRTTWTSFRSW